MLIKSSLPPWIVISFSLARSEGGDPLVSWAFPDEWEYFYISWTPSCKCIPLAHYKALKYNTTYEKRLARGCLVPRFLRLIRQQMTGQSITLGVMLCSHQQTSHYRCFSHSSIHDTHNMVKPLWRAPIEPHGICAKTYNNNRRDRSCQIHTLQPPDHTAEQTNTGIITWSLCAETSVDSEQQTGQTTQPRWIHTWLTQDCGYKYTCDSFWMVTVWCSHRSEHNINHACRYMETQK